MSKETSGIKQKIQRCKLVLAKETTCGKIADSCIRGSIHSFVLVEADACMQPKIIVIREQDPIRNYFYLIKSLRVDAFQSC